MDAHPGARRQPGWRNRARLLLVGLVVAGCCRTSVAGLIDVRSMDGTGNNQTPALWNSGAAETPLSRHPLAPATYPGPTHSGDEIMQAPDRENPRVISNTIFAQGSRRIASRRKLSDFVWQWGQFLDHDIDLTEASAAHGTADIPVPPGDILGPGPIPFSRSHYAPGTGVPGLPRQQMNEITAFIDASNVYGSNATRAQALRTNDGSGARLKTSTGNLLPWNTDGLPNAGGTGPELFLAGDVRANEQIGLTSMHTLFVREHNRLVDALSALPGPTRSDEQLYQTARKIVGAEMQMITYNEFLPALLGTNATSLDTYGGYDDSVDPSIRNEFSAAAFRLGHSMLSSSIALVQNDGSQSGSIPLRSAFFRPDWLGAPGHAGNLDLILKGLASNAMQEIDTLLVDDVRNFLFGPPGAGGLDLAALNIQRGRDHGLPDYNSLRDAYGLGRVTRFDQITSNPELADQLEAIYGSVDNIDAWVGGLAEDHMAGASTGQLIYTIVVDQFMRLRDGDRFFCLNDPDLDHPDVAAVIDLDTLTLADVIRANTNVTQLRSNVFFVPEPSTLWLLLFAVASVACSGRRAIGTDSGDDPGARGMSCRRGSKQPACWLASRA